jgi:2-dehydro-3-deoxy-D-gluconate 5-dehydrogenase
VSPTPSMLDRLRLDGKVAFVSGASRTVGVAVALALARAGADIAASGVPAVALEEIAELVKAQGVRFRTLASHVVDGVQIAASLGRALSSLGRVDIVVHCVEGCSFVTPYYGRQKADLAKRAEANLIGLARLCDDIARHVVSLRTSSLVIIVPPVSNRPWPDITAVAVRQALLELTKTLAQEWAPTGLRVNAITPGVVLTDHPRGEDPFVASTAIPPDRSRALTSVTDAVVWLASDAASHVTGAHIPLDGPENVAVAGAWQLLLKNALPERTISSPSQKTHSAFTDRRSPSSRP